MNRLTKKHVTSSGYVHYVQRQRYKHEDLWAKHGKLDDKALGKKDSEGKSLRLGQLT